MRDYLENEHDDYPEIRNLRESFKAENDPPKQIENPDFSQLREVCQSYMDEISKGGYVDEDLPHYIFEEAIQALFGKDVWKYINPKRV